MEKFARAQMSPEERKAQLERKLAEKKAELAAKKAAQVVTVHDEEDNEDEQLRKDGEMFLQEGTGKGNVGSAPF